MCRKIGWRRCARLSRRLSEFKAEAKKSKLVMNYVSAQEIDGLVKEILDISPKAKEGLQFLVRKQKEN